jgi:hypothetical protein
MIVLCRLVHWLVALSGECSDAAQTPHKFVQNKRVRPSVSSLLSALLLAQWMEDRTKNGENGEKDIRVDTGSSQDEATQSDRMTLNCQP